MGKQLVPAELYLSEEKSQRQQGKEYITILLQELVAAYFSLPVCAQIQMVNSGIYMHVNSVI